VGTTVPSNDWVIYNECKLIWLIVLEAGMSENKEKAFGEALWLYHPIVECARVRETWVEEGKRSNLPFYTEDTVQMTNPLLRSSISSDPTERGIVGAEPSLITS
jgi:hypothetical protein